jgi:hypothetical protein
MGQATDSHCDFLGRMKPDTHRRIHQTKVSTTPSYHFKTRLPGRGFCLDVSMLTELLRETEIRHGSYEPTAPKHHWSGWYAAYIVARERGATADEAARNAMLHIEGTRERARA